MMSPPQELQPSKHSLRGRLFSIREYLILREGHFAAAWASHAFKRLMKVQWRRRPTPEYFTQSINLYYQWIETRSPWWLERGVYCCLPLAEGTGKDVLELCCGDGFYARNFFSHRAQNIVACDFDTSAIAHASTFNTAKNIQFVLADIRTDMPAGTFDCIIWNAAIEHFTELEMAGIFEAIKTRLKPGGILSGYTMVEREDGKKSLEQHEHEFSSKEELLSVLRPHFEKVSVFETVYPDRHNLYFWASNDTVPFSGNWKSMVSIVSG